LENSIKQSMLMVSIHLSLYFKAPLRNKACSHQRLVKVMRSACNFSVSLHALDGRSARIRYFVCIGKLLSSSVCKGTKIHFPPPCVK